MPGRRATTSRTTRRHRPVSRAAPGRKQGFMFANQHQGSRRAIIRALSHSHSRVAPQMLRRLAVGVWCAVGLALPPGATGATAAQATTAAQAAAFTALTLRNGWVSAPFHTSKAAVRL